MPLLASQISTTALTEDNVTHNQFRTPQSLPDVNPGLPPAAASTWPASSNGTAHHIPVTQYHETVGNESISHHYQYVIDHVKRAGFESFDALVSGYYTLSFTRNSTADRAQKASRAKRLRSVLESLHKHSKEWTKWEARGFQEQTVQAAEGIYVAELGELQLDSDVNIYGTVDDLPPIEIQKSQVLQNLQRQYENKVPNLWALFTELAGASSPHTEDATILSLTLLHSINTNPELNLRETIINLVDRLL
ncbi:hypothetical protein ASPWEDRAFT_164005 [Aspergillus wentii DTO 134E9]|uniref:Uncharacterized protein n=1 Tax=Aspergillus wentii DTO 134E9 TaxID=1073089 RepID=A0A1L9R5B0_ASPWE|nr:uncharacterized protein ASPWEDRAFT_164005 [Aspergillus wentii DTO 134E9]OJJ30101.1 hypothetical protein ASPWEDRAFT_164005 [Aspergillus wentii DTO 134E9]